MTTAPVEVEEPSIDEADLTTRGWNVIVWDDPVNLMSYVVYVFRKLFGFTETVATRKMLEVHHDGKSVVATAPREKAELDCHQLHHYGLWATIEQA